MTHVGQIRSRLEVLLVFLTLFVSGGFISLDVQLLVSASAIIAILLLILIVSRGSIKKSAANRAAMIFSFEMSTLFVKLLLADPGFKYTPFLFRIYGNALLSTLILMYFYSNRQRLFECVYIALLLILIQSVISILIWPAVNNSLTPSGVEDINTFNYIVFYPSTIGLTSTQLFGQTIPRNPGIFWEPGILQMYLNVLLFIVLFIRNNIKIAILTIVAILSTWSTTGVVILGAQAIFYSLINFRKPIYASLAIIILFLLTGQIADNIHEKFEGEYAGSGYSRALDTLTAIKIIEKYPAFGIDLNFEAFENNLYQNIANVQMEGRFESREARATNSLLVYYVFFGLFIGSFIVYGLYNQRLFNKNRWFIFIILALSLSTEPLGFFLFPILLIISGYMYTDNRVARELQNK